MEYRRFGHLDWDVSVLGFGCARFPTVDDKPFGADIVEAEAIRMLHYAIDHGVNYVDTAYIYHAGNSELLVGKALAGAYRHKVRLASKSPLEKIEQPADFDRYLNEQLGKLQTDHLDFYLLHGLSGRLWRKVCDLDLIGCAERAIADGRIGHLGFSFHDNFETFQTIVDGYEHWTFCQFILNFLDTEFEAGLRGLELAVARGIAPVIMEPVKGGKLAAPPPAVQALWDSAVQPRSPAGWALQWVWDQPGVCVALSGMSDMAQVEENVARAGTAERGRLSEDERELIARVREAYKVES